MKTITLMTILIAALFLTAGCGGGDDAATQAEEAATHADQAAETAGEVQVATHDCAGGCGMTAVPENQMTEVDGKWYCAGCVDRVKVEDAGHDPDTE